MPSWQSRVFDRYVRLFVRRRDWGEHQALARRARRLFGAPALQQRLLLRGLSHERVHTPEGVRGEWIAVSDPLPGVLLYVHGGGYVSCSPAQYAPVTTALARLTRRRVFVVDYRLAPEARFPTALDDVTASYRWLLDREGGASRIAVAGDSAGGGLALLLAIHARDAGWAPPACVAALSPWTDLAATGESIRANDGRCAMFRPENMAAFARAYLGDASPDDPRASPLRADLDGLPPVLLQVGSTELLLDDARRVHERIREGGGASTLTVYDDVMHGWHLLAPFVPESRAALAEVARFVRQHLDAGANVGANASAPRAAGS
jgi:monoterpene epsilon-lactone hydrolase